MRLLVIVIGVLLALNVVVWVFTPSGTDDGLPHMITSVEQLKAELKADRSRFASVNTGLSGSPYEDAEYARMNLRRLAREAMFEAFRAPWSSFCTETGHARLKDAINYYFYHRRNQQRLAESARGREGLVEARAKWATGHDALIDQWTRQTFGRANFDLAELETAAASSVAEIVRDMRPADVQDCTDRTEPVTRPSTLAELPWTEHEQRLQQERDAARRGALAFLAQPGATLCEGTLQGWVSPDLSRYFEMMSQQRRLYGRNWGEAGERYLAESWGTSDDKQIRERLREAVAGGTLTAAAVRPGTQLVVNGILRGIQPVAAGCSG